MNLQSKLQRFYPHQIVAQNETVGREVADSLSAGTPTPTNLVIYQHRRNFHSLKTNLSFDLSSDEENQNVFFYDKKNITLKDIFFLDVECTGLGMNQNNIPYLIGCAYFDEQGLIIKQIFSSGLFAENSALDFLDKLWHKFKVIVTYNGKSFDVPLIKSRFYLYNKTFQNNFLEHFDLYHIIKKIQPNFRHRLSDVEMFFLNAKRINDVGGAYSGQAYYEFLHFQNRELLDKIILHNQHDIESLAAMTLKLNQLCKDFAQENKISAPKIYKLATIDVDTNVLFSKPIKDGEDYFHIGQHYYRQKKIRRAAINYAKAFRFNHQQGAEDLCKLLIKLNKRLLAQKTARYILERSEEKIQKKIVKFLE